MANASTKKKSVFSKLLLVLIVIVAAFCVVVTMQPDEFRITRSATIASPASKIFPHVNNLHQWEEWSPWAKLDPNAKTSFEGKEQGIGAKMSWDGNKEVGKGSMLITDSRRDEFVKFELDFTEPMKSTHTAEFTFAPEGKETKVTWTMYGTNNFVGKAFGLLFNCEKMLGEQFDKGLASLKKISES